MSAKQIISSIIAFGIVFAHAAPSSTQVKHADGSSAATKRADAKTPGPTALTAAFVKSIRDAMVTKDGKPLEMTLDEDVTSTAAQEELRLLAAEALVQEQHTLAAQIIRMDVAARAIGTSQGVWALYALDQMAQEFELDESAMEEMAYEYDANVDGASERAMLSWYRAKALLRRGYSEWALLDLSKVGIDTRWYADRVFDRATDALAEGKGEEAEALYANILKRTTPVRNPTRQFAELNRARMIFEKGDYEETLKIMRSVDLPLRERARGLLEMAWARYYMKDYGKALGVLRVVDSAFFEALRSPESDVLQMVISRDLCRYDLIKTSATAFRERYKKPFKQIEARLSLEADPQLKQMALQGRFLQRRATLIHRYRTERKAIYDEDLRISKGLREMLLKNLLMRERKTESEIARALPRELDRVASELLDFREQVSFLEYEASIRPLTAMPNDEVDYLPEAASKTKFEKLYWPVINESWWDELDNYEVLIRARCAQPLPALAPVKKKSAPKFEEESGSDIVDEEGE